MKLVDLAKHAPAIILDIRYATANNFMQRQIYKTPSCYLHIDAANALQRVQKALVKQGLGLKVYDGFRPIEAQAVFWDAIRDPRFVAPPENSRHTRGTAVDVTLVNKKGEELEMPTAFDTFSDKAHHKAQNITAAAKKNRALLLQAMENGGFIPIDTEWWHYDFLGWETYPIIRDSFAEIEQKIALL